MVILNRKCHNLNLHLTTNVLQTGVLLLSIAWLFSFMQILSYSTTKASKANISGILINHRLFFSQYHKLKQNVLINHPLLSNFQHGLSHCAPCHTHTQLILCSSSSHSAEIPNCPKSFSEDSTSLHPVSFNVCFQNITLNYKFTSSCACMCSLKCP